jgi:hypothetical protein
MPRNPKQGISHCRIADARRLPRLRVEKPSKPLTCRKDQSKAVESQLGATKVRISEIDAAPPSE